jgi:hypothetical protein
MKTLVKKPACCSNTEIARFEALVNEGGSRISWTSKTDFARGTAYFYLR